MYDAEGVIKFIDFGFAVIMEQENDEDKKNLGCVGTPDFMAPEVMDNGEYGKECDIWSLGVVLYQVLHNKELPFTAFNGKNHQ